MSTRLAWVGNSVSARLPKAVLQELDLAAGDEVDIRVRNRSIVIKPVRKPVRNRLTLRKLLKGTKAGSRGKEFEWERKVDGELL